MLSLAEVPERLELKHVQDCAVFDITDRPRHPQTLDVHNSLICLCIYNILAGAGT